MAIRTLGDLQNALDSYGADISLWPAELRDSAATLLANSADARKRVETLLKLERLLRAPASAEAPAGLADRIVASALQRRRSKSQD